MPTKSVAVKSADAVPVEYSGKWVAWNSSHSRIVAQSTTVTELWDIVKEQRIENPVFEKIPRSDARLVGKR